MAVLMLDEVLRELVGPHIHHVDVWSDCGAHFRSYEIAAWACVTVVRKYSVGCGSVFSCAWNYFGEHHRKIMSRCFFGLVDRWLQISSTQMKIATYAELHAALSLEAKEAEAMDPPPRGCSYRIVL